LGLTTKEDMSVIEAGVSAGSSKELQMQAQVQKVKEITGVELPSYYNPSAINPLQYAEQIKKRKMLWGNKGGGEDAEPQEFHGTSGGGEGGGPEMAYGTGSRLPVGAQAYPPPPKPAPAPLMSIKTTPSMSSLAVTAQPRGLALLAKNKPQQPQQQQQQQQPKTSFNKWESTNLGDNQANEKFRRLMGIKGGGAAPAAPSGGNSGHQSAAPTSSTSQAMFADQEMQYERARAITHTKRGLGLGFSSHSQPEPAQPPPQQPQQPPIANSPSFKSFWSGPKAPFDPHQNEGAPKPYAPPPPRHPPAHGPPGGGMHARKF